MAVPTAVVKEEERVGVWVADFDVGKPLCNRIPFKPARDFFGRLIVVDLIAADQIQSGKTCSLTLSTFINNIDTYSSR